MKTEKNFKLTKYACYSCYLGMSSIFCIPPMLFMTFKDMYNISYTLLGSLVLVNFFTQLTIDLIFTFFSKHFNIKYTLRIMPILTSIGLFIYSFSPHLFPNNVYIGLVIGTVIFSVSAGLSEVLLSPTIAAIPSKNPDKDMSFLHSLYAYGVLTFVIITTLFFNIFGSKYWMYLTMFCAVLPIISFVLFSISPIPEFNTETETKRQSKKGKGFALLLCVVCIFLGSSAENSMTNWISSYLENALNIPKSYGDILGLALFAVLLGLGRTLYAKYGKNISNVLLFGMIGAFVCYTVASVSTNPIVSMIACVLTGMCTSMLWPGTLIFMEENISGVSIAAYALMASGGDLGASVAPQMIGIIVDKVAVTDFAKNLGATLSLSAEQIGMKTGMLIAAIFPLIGIFLVLFMKHYFKKKNKQ